MNKRLLFLMASLLLCGTLSAQQQIPYNRAHDNNMPVVAQVVLDGEALETGGYELQAYIDDELRGSAQIQPTLDNTYWIQVYYSTDTEAAATVSFKLYDGDDEYTAETTLTIDPEGYGTPGTPQVIEFATTQMQTMQFAQGWTWWSTYIELSNVDGLSLLENALGEDGLFIKAGNGQYVEYVPDWEMWWGDDDMIISNENSYEIGVSANRSTSLPGRIANPSEHPITISQGWNWIGYPVSTQLTVDNAFSSINPSEDDILQDRNGFSTYYPGYGFWGDIENMVPGSGYKYKAYGSGSQTLVYPSGNRNNHQIVMKENKLESYEHRYIMNVIAIAEIDGEEISEGAYEIQAMANGTVRGRSTLRYCEPTGQYVAMLTIYGDSNEKLQFVLNDTETAKSYSVNESFSFDSERVIGTLSSPFAFHANSSMESLCIKDMFPNPVKSGNEVYIELIKERIEGLLWVELFNGLGEKVYNYSCSATPISFKAPITSGVYIVRITTKDGLIYHGNLIVTQ